MSLQGSYYSKKVGNLPNIAYTEKIMYKFTIDDTSSDYEIYVNPISSSAGKYLSRRPQVFALIKEVAATCKLQGSRVVIEKDMGRDIGTTDVISTNDKDVIYYAKPSKSEVYSRFAKNRFPQTCSMLTVVFERDSDGNYEVSDTWIGQNHPPFPGDESESATSKDFWESHALVQDAQIIQSRSITKVCPY